MEHEDCPNLNKRGYVLLYGLETMLRNFVTEKLENKSQEEKGGGWLRYVPPEILKKCEKRAEKERHSYQSLGSDQLIDYSDFSDLGKIIDRNKEVFGGVFGDIQVVLSKLKELELIRNTIAHNRKLTRGEFNRLDIFNTDLRKAAEIGLV